MPEPLLTDPTSVVRLPKRSAEEEIERIDREKFITQLIAEGQGISPSSAGPEHAGPMSARATTQLQPGGMDQMGFAEQMAAREEIARALNGTGGSNMLTRLFGMDR